MYPVRCAAAGVVGIALLAGGAPASFAGEVKVGIFNSLTGVTAYGGVPIHNAMKLAINQANASGELGDTKIRIVEGDTASDKGQSITLFNKFVQSDNVLMVLGPTTSFEANATAPVANDQKTPLFAIGSSKDILKAGPWSFKVQEHAVDIMGVLGDYAVKTLGSKKIAVVFGRENDGLITQKDAFKKSVTDQGATIVSEDGILSADTDFLALATRVAASSADTVFLVPASPEQCANIIMQMRQAGIRRDVKMIGPSTLASKTFITHGGSAVEGAIVLSDYFPSNPSDTNQRFVKAYKDAYGANPDNWAAMGYTLARLAVKAIKEAGPNPDRSKVRDQLSRLRDVPVVIGAGNWTIDQDRNPHYGGLILEVKKGDFALAK